MEILVKYKPFSSDNYGTWYQHIKVLFMDKNGWEITMDVLLNGLSISAKKELQSLCCMMEKTISLRCLFLAANGWRLID